MQRNMDKDVILSSLSKHEKQPRCLSEENWVLGMVACLLACNSSPQKVKAGRSEVQSQLKLQKTPPP